MTSKGGETFLTRDGQFTINEDRYLQTSSGAYVLGENHERIRIPEGTKVKVQEDGMLYDAVSQNHIARLQTKMVNTEVNARLVRRENKSFTLAEGGYC